jgi:hypothetical protein
VSRRIVDPGAIRIAGLEFDECAACGGPQANVHHVVQKSSPHFGDDLRENLVSLCGSGTMGCHGALHGSPYVVTLRRVERSQIPVRVTAYRERRDAEWVARRIGLHLAEQRPDVIAYVLRKLGGEQGRAYLRRFYYLEVSGDGPQETE